MSNPPGHLFPPSDEDFTPDDTDVDVEADIAASGKPIEQDADRPVDPDLDDDLIDSAAADERAAREGTLPTDEEPA